MTVSPSFYIYSATIETNISLARILLLISPYFCTNIRLLESRLSLSCSFHIYLKAGVVTRLPQVPQILFYFPPYLYANFTSLDPRLSFSFFPLPHLYKTPFFFFFFAIVWSSYFIIYKQIYKTIFYFF
jgi:hypothetical protein